jgi:NAD(P)-dependent dehydrogenase (short-subunit alcohol dehydrogenase family)
MPGSGGLEVAEPGRDVEVVARRTASMAGAGRPVREAQPTALVTGAGGHVGEALLRLLTAAGYRTIGVERPGVPVPGDANAEPDRWVEADLADPAAEVALAEALADLPRLDVVVAAAGVTALGDLDTTRDATFRHVIDVNFHGALRTTRATLPALRRAGGYLVVLSSVAGFLPVPGRPAYVGAKHAVTGTFLALAGELARDGVAVTVVHPGFLSTPVTEAGAGAEAGVGVGGGAARSTTGVSLEADDVARAIVRLVAGRRAGRHVPSRLLVGRTARLADLVHRVAPGVARRIAARRLRG